MIDELKQLLTKREADDRSALLHTATALAAGKTGKAGKNDVAETAALLHRLGLTVDDLEQITDLARERAAAAAAAKPLADLQRAARETMQALRDTQAARAEAVRELDVRLAAAEHDHARAEQEMRVAGEAGGRVRELDRRLRLAIGVDADTDKRITRLPDEINNLQSSEAILRNRLHTATARLQRAERAIAEPRLGDDELLRNELTAARADVEQLEAELAALPALIAAKTKQLETLEAEMAR